MSFRVNNNLLLNILLYTIAFGILIGSGSLFRYAYSYNLIMTMTIIVMSSVIFYQIFIPVNNINNYHYNVNLSGLILLTFFIFFPIMSDVINQVKSYEITYFYIVFLLITYLLGAKYRDKILSYYLVLMVILSFISLFFFFAELLFELPSFIPYYGIPEDQSIKSHFYYVWSNPTADSIFIRNQSIFWEPGAFGFHLIIAILLAYKAKNKLFITVLIVAGITTMSTTVYIFMSILVIFQLFWGNNKIMFISVLFIGLLLFLIIVRSIWGNFEIPLFFINVITDKFDMSSAASASMKERTLFVTEAFNLFLDNIAIGAGHYSTNTELENIISTTSGLVGLLAELGLFGALCILLYIRFFKYFKILAIPIAIIWLNGEFMQYTALSLFILIHMVDDVAQNLFPNNKINANSFLKYKKNILPKLKFPFNTNEL